MLPLGLLTAAQGNPILVELKSGETINGHLVNCDTYMNLTLKEVVTTSADGKHFFRLSETYVRGNNIKFLRVPDETINRAKDQQQSQQVARVLKGTGESRYDGVDELGASVMALLLRPVRNAKDRRQLALCLAEEVLGKSADIAKPPRLDPQNAMHTTNKLTVDGLWHCLCPSFNPASLRTATSSTQQPRIPLYGCLTTPPAAPRRSAAQARHFTSSTGLGQVVRVQHGRAEQLIPRTGRDPDEVFHRVTKNSRRRLLGGDQSLHDKDTPALYDVLRKSATMGFTKVVEDVVEVLIKERREQPNESPELYHTLIEANANHELGSAGRVVTLLEEMQREGLEPDARTCDAILKVLAVHPDYVLRAAVLEHLRALWSDLPAEGHRNVVVGMLRDRQYEMALDRLDSMQSAGVRVEPWLWDMAIYALCEVDEIDEALALLKKRDALAELSYEPSVWAFVLDTASRAFHYHATLYVWRKRVEPGYLNPASGLCLNVLCTAARAGDPVLATDVFRVLGNRATVFEHQHYEMLIDTYLATDDLKTAISILSVMEGAKMAPDEATTRNLFKYLRADANRPHAALAVLQSLRETGKPVPVAAVNVVLEALVHLVDLAGALEVYKTLHALCACGPTVATFNAILKGCSSDADEADTDEPLEAGPADYDLTSDKKATAMFLAAEMRALDVAPDAVTYDRLILVCLRAPDCEDALRYYAEMRSRHWLPRPGTFTAIVKRLARDGDVEHAAEVLAQARDAGFELLRTERWLETVLWRRRRWEKAEADGEGRLAGFVRERLGGSRARQGHVECSK